MLCNNNNNNKSNNIIIQWKPNSFGNLIKKQKVIGRESAQVWLWKICATDNFKCTYAYILIFKNFEPYLTKYNSFVFTICFKNWKRSRNTDTRFTR